ncbi:MAG: hypothetical protein KGV59_01775 [Tenacibaculum sp.]|nr:hypothetical protein [Tenacibaculum sp.]
MKFNKDIVGWAGVICLLFAYYGLTVQELFTSKSLEYNVINLAGGVCLAWRVWQDRNVPNFIFELVFVAIALFNLFKFFV